jgi:hypothetical protein
MAVSLKDKRTPVTTPPYQVPSVDVTPDPPTFSLDTTFKRFFYEQALDFIALPDIWASKSLVPIDKYSELTGKRAGEARQRGDAESMHIAHICWSKSCKPVKFFSP